MSDLLLRSPIGNGSITMLVGDVRDRLADIPDDSIDCIVTSPPYWGLRDYDTGTWIGGDPACEHIVGELRIGAGLQHPKVNARGGGKKASKVRAIRARSQCPKCGAIRHDAQIGMEPTLGEHIDVLVAIFRELKRVLKPSGTLWLNYGDSYATEPNGRSAKANKAAGTDDRTYRDKPFTTIGPIYGALSGRPNAARNGKTRRGGGNNPSGPIYDPGHRNGGNRGANKGRDTNPSGRVVAGGYLKPKDLCMIPNRLAIALQEDGWWVRAEAIWGKKNPMPDSSGVQRPSTAHEKIWLLTKSGDAEVYRARDTGEISFFPDLKERVPFPTKPDKMGARWTRIGAYYNAVEVFQPSEKSTAKRLAQDIENQAGSDRAYGGMRHNGPMKAVASRPRAVPPRHAGQINHEFLSQLGRGNGRLLRNYEPAPLVVWPMANEQSRDDHYATFPTELAAMCLKAGCPPGGRVLDPFGGTGTTAIVAVRLGLDAVLIELSEKYADIARRRIERDWMGPDERARDIARSRPPRGDAPLLEGIGS